MGALEISRAFAPERSTALGVHSAEKDQVPIDLCAQYPTAHQKALPSEMALFPHRTAGECTPAQSRGSCRRPSRPVDTRTSECCCHSQTLPSPAFANRAFPEHAQPSLAA